jgi:hypothetical protein
VQQRNGRKSITTLSGLQKEVAFSKLLKAMKKEFWCVAVAGWQWQWQWRGGSSGSGTVAFE